MFSYITAYRENLALEEYQTLLSEDMRKYPNFFGKLSKESQLKPATNLTCAPALGFESAWFPTGKPHRYVKTPPCEIIGNYGQAPYFAQSVLGGGILFTDCYISLFSEDLGAGNSYEECSPCTRPRRPKDLKSHMVMSLGSPTGPRR